MTNIPVNNIENIQKIVEDNNIAGAGAVKPGYIQADIETSKIEETNDSVAISSISSAAPSISEGKTSGAGTTTAEKEEPYIKSDIVNLFTKWRFDELQMNSIAEVNNASEYIDPSNASIQILLSDLKEKGIITDGMTDDEVVVAIHNYVVENFNYITDKDGDIWYTVDQTIKNGGGDCEDLSNLEASLIMAAFIDRGMSIDEASKRVSCSVVQLTETGIGHVFVQYIDESGIARHVDPTSLLYGGNHSINSFEIVGETSAYNTIFTYNINSVNIVNSDFDLSVFSTEYYVPDVNAWYGVERDQMVEDAQLDLTIALGIIDDSYNDLNNTITALQEITLEGQSAQYLMGDASWTAINNQLADVDAKMGIYRNLVSALPTDNTYMAPEQLEAIESAHDDINDSIIAANQLINEALVKDVGVAEVSHYVEFYDGTDEIFGAAADNEAVIMHNGAMYIVVRTYVGGIPSYAVDRMENSYDYANAKSLVGYTCVFADFIPTVAAGEYDNQKSILIDALNNALTYLNSSMINVSGTTADQTWTAIQGAISDITILISTVSGYSQGDDWAGVASTLDTIYENIDSNPMSSDSAAMNGVERIDPAYNELSSVFDVTSKLNIDGINEDVGYNTIIRDAYLKTIDAKNYVNGVDLQLNILNMNDYYHQPDPNASPPEVVDEDEDRGVFEATNFNNFKNGLCNDLLMAKNRLETAITALTPYPEFETLITELEQLRQDIANEEQVIDQNLAQYENPDEGNWGLWSGLQSDLDITKIAINSKATIISNNRKEIKYLRNGTVYVIENNLNSNDYYVKRTVTPPPDDLTGILNLDELSMIMPALKYVNEVLGQNINSLSLINPDYSAAEFRVYTPVQNNGKVCVHVMQATTDESGKQIYERYSSYDTSPGGIPAEWVSLEQLTADFGYKDSTTYDLDTCIELANLYAETQSGLITQEMLYATNVPDDYYDRIENLINIADRGDISDIDDYINNITDMHADLTAAQAGIAGDGFNGFTIFQGKKPANAAMAIMLENYGGVVDAISQIDSAYIDLNNALAAYNSLNFDVFQNIVSDNTIIHDALDPLSTIQQDLTPKNSTDINMLQSFIDSAVPGDTISVEILYDAVPGGTPGADTELFILNGLVDDEGSITWTYDSMQTEKK